MQKSVISLTKRSSAFGKVTQNIRNSLCNTRINSSEAWKSWAISSKRPVLRNNTLLYKAVIMFISRSATSLSERGVEKWRIFGIDALCRWPLQEPSAYADCGHAWTTRHDAWRIANDGSDDLKMVFLLSREVPCGRSVRSVVNIWHWRFSYQEKYHKAVISIKSLI